MCSPHHSYVLGFVPTLRFFGSEILCRLYKGPLGEMINNLQTKVPRVYTYKLECAQTQSYIHVKDPVVHARVWWIMETLK